jgi:membrane fusion protein, multidrug efflux system
MPQRPPPLVTVTPAVARDVPVYLDEIGTTQASAVVNIQSQVAGQILERRFQDGQDLVKGAILYEIDPRPFQDAVKQAQANFEQAKAQLVLAQGDYDRMAKQVPTGAVSPEDLSAKAGALNAAKAAVQVTQAALNTANLNLAYCTITCPIDGRAGRRLVDAGNLVKANDATLVTIQTLAPLYVDFTITERDLPGVRERMANGTLKAQVTIPDRPNESRTGDLTFLDTQVQPNAGRIMMRATLPNADRHFWPGQFVNVRLVLERIPHAVLVPYACVQIAQQGPYVYIVAGGKAHLQPVMLGQRQEDLIVVQKGVAAGDQIVETGQLAVTPEGPVRLLEAPASSPAVAGADAGGRP